MDVTPIKVICGSTYNGLIGLLIECVKQQQVEIEELKRKVG